LAHPDHPTLGREQVLVDLTRREHGLDELVEELDDVGRRGLEDGSDAAQDASRHVGLRDDQPNDQREEEEADDPPDFHNNHRSAAELSP
jgi:hypothetical protein